MKLRTVLPYVHFLPNTFNFLQIKSNRVLSIWQHHNYNQITQMLKYLPTFTRSIFFSMFSNTFLCVLVASETFMKIERLQHLRT